MTKSELKDLLIKESIPTHFYSLDGGLPYDAWCIAKTPTGWDVYYTERGEKYQVENFITEEEACERLHQRIKKMMEYL
jgi:hypothetical protein